MASVRDITSMCKAGQVAEAYRLAKADYDADPQNIWTQRGLGWALYYMLKSDIEQHDRKSFYGHLNELPTLDLLTPQPEEMIFDNILWKIVEIIKQVPQDNAYEIDYIFNIIAKYTFGPSQAYSALVRQVLDFDSWPRLVEFFEWWNIANLSSGDYLPFKMDNGKQIMSLAERLYIAYSKALLKLNDVEKIRDFVPKIEQLIEDYPQMMYPGYFCGKLMLAMGAEREAALDIVMPFVRKKKGDFWVWQLLAELYSTDPDTSLACLSRAVHCNTQEQFLGKLRIKLVSIYVIRNDYGRAKHHLDQLTRCYMQQGWRLPYQVQDWMREPWVQTTQADDSDAINYKQYTDAILARGANQSIAVVTYVDNARKRAMLVYGSKLRTNVSLANLALKVKVGTLLQIQWMSDTEGCITIVGAKPADINMLKNLLYIRMVEGKIVRRDGNPFAFIKNGDMQCYVNPDIVQKHNLCNANEVALLAVMDYNKKKDSWNWTCVSIIKNKQ